MYRGFEPGPVDGVMGNLTRTALRRFQAQEGLPVRGELDDVTEARLSARPARTTKTTNALSETAPNSPKGIQDALTAA